MPAIRRVPHPFPYQGSKRQLASQVLSCIPRGTRRIVEPFAGSAAVSIAAAYKQRARRFVINDVHEPLISLWGAIVHEPKSLAAEYRRLWMAQRGRERPFYDEVRRTFNKAHQPHDFLYLLARCVKAAVRYNRQGEFNNSPDNRRKGMHPDLMAQNIQLTSELLAGRVVLHCRDYKSILARTRSTDVVYMDPPYQGVCDTRDHRYFHGVPFGEFVNALDELNERGISFIVSYDGRTGEKVHGRRLPRQLGLSRVEIVAGRSTQATLLGKHDETIESLYLSPALMERLGTLPDALRPCLQGELFVASR